MDGWRPCLCLGQECLFRVCEAAQNESATEYQAVESSLVLCHPLDDDDVVRGTGNYYYYYGDKLSKERGGLSRGPAAPLKGRGGLVRGGREWTHTLHSSFGGSSGLHWGLRWRRRGKELLYCPPGWMEGNLKRRRKDRFQEEREFWGLLYPRVLLLLNGTHVWWTVYRQTRWCFEETKREGRNWERIKSMLLDPSAQKWKQSLLLLRHRSFWGGRGGFRSLLEGSIYLMQEIIIFGDRIE